MGVCLVEQQDGGCAGAMASGHVVDAVADHEHRQRIDAAVVIAARRRAGLLGRRRGQAPARRNVQDAGWIGLRRAKGARYHRAELALGHELLQEMCDGHSLEQNNPPRGERDGVTWRRRALGEVFECKGRGGCSLKVSGADAFPNAFGLEIEHQRLQPRLRLLHHHGSPLDGADLIHGLFLLPLFGQGVDVVEDVGALGNAQRGSFVCSSSCKQAGATCFQADLLTNRISWNM